MAQKWVAYWIKLPHRWKEHARIELPWNLDRVRLSENCVVGTEDTLINASLAHPEREHFFDCNLCISAEVEANTPGVLDSEFHELVSIVDRFLQAMRLNMGNDFGGYVIKGHTLDSGEPYAQSLNNIVAPVLLKSAPGYRDASHMLFEECAVLASAIEGVYSDVQAFERFRKGFVSLRDGQMCAWADEQIFYYSRALEALMGMAKGQGLEEFCRRATELTDSSEEKLFRRAYATRNNHVHLNPFSVLGPEFSKPSLNPGNIPFTNESIGDQLIQDAFRLRVLTREIYRKVLLSPTLLSQLSDDLSIQTAWSQGAFGAVSVRWSDLESEKMAADEARMNAWRQPVS